METAVQSGSKPDTYSPDVHEEDDVIEDIVVDKDDELLVGDDFDININLTNKNSNERNVDLTVVVQICYYTG